MSKTFFTFSLCFTFLFVLLHQVNAAPNDPVDIPDAALRAAIETKLGKNSGDTITESEMNGMTGTLSVNYNFVNDLTGLEHATGITEFRVSNNRGEITDISPVKDLTQLTILSIRNYKTTRDDPTALSDISAVTNLTNLVELRIDHSSIVDISPVADLINLKTLTFERNSITDTSSLAKLTALTHLDLRDNKLESLGAAVSNLTALTQLWLGGNKDLTGISPVADLTNLDILHLGTTSITPAGLSAVLPSLSKLEALYISYSPISDLSALGDLPVVLTEVLQMRAISADPNNSWTFRPGDRQGLGWLLTDLTPLVSLMNEGKVITADTKQVDLVYNWGLDYESFYTDIPALKTAGISDVKYSDPVPGLEHESAATYVGRPGTRHTFVARATNTSRNAYKNDEFAEVPVTWKVTAPDGTETETEAVTGDDGLTEISIILGSHGEAHTVDAVVAANSPTNGPTHTELKVSFTATADNTAPIVPDPILPELTVAFEDYPQETPTDTFSLTISFSEPVSGFQAEDISIETDLTDGTGDATLQALTPTTEPTQTYTATVNVPADAVGNIRLTVQAGAAVTPQGQIGPVTDTISEQIAFTRELTVSFGDAPQETPTDTFPLTINFSEPVTGFQAGDISIETELVDGTGTATLQALTPTTEPTQTYTATIKVPADAVGSVRLTIQAGAALTPFGQTGPDADTTSRWVVFGRAVTVSFSGYPQEPPIDTFSLTISFSEPVTGFQADDIRIETELAAGTGTATLQGLTSTTEPTQTYTATIKVPEVAVGNVRLIVREGAALTLFEQSGPIRDTDSRWIAFTRKLRVSFSDYPQEPPIDTFPLTIIFSEPVNGFRADDIHIQTALTTGTGAATLQALTPITEPTQTYTATVNVPADAVGIVRLTIQAGAALTPFGQTGPDVYIASRWIAFGGEQTVPPEDDPQVPSVGGGGGGGAVGGGGSVGGGGVSGLNIRVPPSGRFFIFNEIGNFQDDTNDWMELKNLRNTPLHLSEWEIRFITTDNTKIATEKDVVSFPDFVLPAQAVLLITNTDPSATRLASGLNIATGARQHGAQHPYFVAPDLRLPRTPYLLILQRKVSTNGGFGRTIEDMAGNYSSEMPLDGNPEIDRYSYIPDSTETAAPLTEVGAWQRRRSEQPGYLATAWTSTGYHAHIGYDRHVPASLCLGTPGYVRAPSPPQLRTHRLVFNEIRNASDNANDWIELKNISDTDIRLRGWEISIILDAEQDANIVSLPDYTLPMDGVLLITNTHPSETVIADGLNVATGTRQQGSQRPYFVAYSLRLPSTPYLLVLQHTSEYGEQTIEDVVGNYPFTETSSDGNPEIHLFPNALPPKEPLAPLTQFGAWQRRHLKQPGYLASTWMPSGYHAHIGYDRQAPAALCLGTPGYHLYDPSPFQLVTQHLVFNKIHNATDNPNKSIDWIELKNISDTEVRLRDWEISIVASEGEAPDEDVSIVSFPDYTLPADGLLLIINTDPGKIVIPDGLNIATVAQQQQQTQRPYLVADDLKLPSTPYLLILRHARGKNGTPEAIEDVAGDYFRYDDDTQLWPLAYAMRPSAPAAPLSEAGTYQRKDARQPGYLATAWTSSQLLPNYWYDSKAFAVQLVTRRLAFNKIHNAANYKNDWIELKNVSDTEVRLGDWEISIASGANQVSERDKSIVWFPDYTLPAGGELLITNTDPDEAVIVDGLNIAPNPDEAMIVDGLNITPDTTEATEASDQRGAQHPYLVAHGLRLPNTPYLLILRDARGRSGTPEAIEDVAGNYFNNTEIWPPAYTRHPSAPAAALNEAGAYQRKDARHPGYLATAWTVSQSPPGIPDTSNALEGGENTLFDSDANAAAVVFNPNLPDEVRISELMHETQGPSGELPQWIELYNASVTPVDLEGWQLAIETRTAGKHRNARLTLKTFSLPPKQTVILGTGQDKRSKTLPTERIYELSKAHADVFSEHLDKNIIIGTEGFFVQLIHPTGRVVDTAGNLDGDEGTDDLPTWTLPDGKTPQGYRSSLLRRFEGDVRKGTEAEGWMPAMAIAIGVNTYYGDPTDISTPGFLHQIVPGASPTAALHISEIMFESKIRTQSLPQWIELYNPSFTHSVKLKDCQLCVEMLQEGVHQQVVITLEAFDVLPNQTVLLITAEGRRSMHLTDHLVYNLSQRHPKTFLSLPTPSRLLSREGFLIQLTDATGNVLDTVGNLDGYPATEDTPAWAFPPGETNGGMRASLRRLSIKQMPLDGRHAEAWVSTADVPPKIITYYGHSSDVGNPGYRKGGPLPVTLSSFSAAWRTDNVQIRWTTESELNNAGFNILRSQTKEGEFQQINTQLIQGAGTTSERNAYTWTDTTAKPDTVYYYRIEDVSYTGERKQLVTVRIRGLVSPNGKRITRWADVKNQQ